LLAKIGNKNMYATVLVEKKEIREKNYMRTEKKTTEKNR
jgi:hypothetical protein